MEGDHLIYFITYKDRQAIITLSEYDTVEQLKLEISNNFDISVVDQVINGWHSVPESDDFILQFCSNPNNDINCLVVTSRMDTMENSIHMQLEATRRFARNLPDSIPLKIEQMSLQDAMSHMISSHKKQALLLYLHNPQDVFSQNFLTYAYDDKIADILNEFFLIIGWDIEDETYHRALLSALTPYASVSNISYLVTEKIGAAVCILLEENEPVIFSCLRGDQCYQVTLESLINIQRHLNLTETDYDNGSDDLEENNTLYNKYEIEAIKSTKRKMPPNTSVTFPLCTLDDAIEFICTSPFDKRKAMLLYLHNSEYSFSKMFSNNLMNGELVEILNRSFFVLGWNVEEVRYHDALASAVSRQVNLSLVADLVRNKVSVGLCILPIAGTISVFMCLRDKITLKQTIKSLKEVEEILKVEIEKEKELKKLEKEKSNQNDLGSEKLQSIWADMLGDRDYDSFEYNEHKYLKDKIGYGLRGPPQKETGYDDKTIAQIEQLYNVIKTESNEIAEFRDTIEISSIYNCLEPLPEEKMERAAKYPDYNPQTDVNPVPIFILRKCRESNNPCRIFIDDTGRVYQSWKGYLTKNKFPKCEMIVPLNGRYQVKNDKVLLEKHLSPACHLDTKLLQVGDGVSTVAGLASGAIFILAAIPAVPVAAPILIGAAVTGAAAGLWAIGRSIGTLADRAIHKESMSFANSEARGAYLNIVAGSLGFVGAGANLALTQMVKSGANIGQGVTYFVNTVGVVNIGASGACLANSGYEVFDQWYNEKRAPSALTILQLSTSVLFFGHAVFNFKGAQTIIDETQARVLQDYQDSLRSNRHRKTFNKLLKETMRTQGDSARGRAEVISAIRNIQNKDEVFAALTRNNKAMNRAGIRFAADGGQIKLDGIAVDMNEFIGLNKKQTETFLTNLSQQHLTEQPRNISAPSTNYSVPLKTAINDILSECGVDSKGVNFNQIIQLTTQFLVFLRGDVRSLLLKAIHTAIRYTFSKLSIPIVEEIDKIFPKQSQYLEFLRVGIGFFSQLVDKLEDDYKSYTETNDQKYYSKIFEYANPLYTKRTVQFFEFVVMNSYSGETLVKAILEKFSSFLIAWVTRVIFENEEKRESENRRLRHSAGFRVKKVNCSECGGYYFNHV